MAQIPAAHDRLLAEITALGEADRLRRSARLHRQMSLVDIDSIKRRAGLDAEDFVGIAACQPGARLPQQVPNRRCPRCRANQIIAGES